MYCILYYWAYGLRPMSNIVKEYNIPQTGSFSILMLNDWGDTHSVVSIRYSKSQSQYLWVEYTIIRTLGFCCAIEMSLCLRCQSRSAPCWTVAFWKFCVARWSQWHTKFLSPQTCVACQNMTFCLVGYTCSSCHSRHTFYILLELTTCRSHYSCYEWV